MSIPVCGWSFTRGPRVTTPPASRTPLNTAASDQNPTIFNERARMHRAMTIWIPGCLSIGCLDTRFELYASLIKLVTNLCRDLFPFFLSSIRDFSPVLERDEDEDRFWWIFSFVSSWFFERWWNEVTATTSGKDRRVIIDGFGLGTWFFHFFSV